MHKLWCCSVNKTFGDFPSIGLHLTQKNMEPQSCFHHIRELIARDQMQEAMAALRTLVENTPRLNEVLLW